MGNLAFPNSWTECCLVSLNDEEGDLVSLNELKITWFDGEMATETIDHSHED